MEHFQELLNRNSSVDETIFEEIDQLRLNWAQPLRGTYRLHTDENGKAPGNDGIAAKIFKHGGTELEHWIQKLTPLIWVKDELALDLPDADIVRVFKKSKLNCFKNLNWTVKSHHWTVSKITTEIKCEKSQLNCEPSGPSYKTNLFLTLKAWATY